MSLDKKPPALVETNAPLISTHKILERVKTKVGERLRARGVFGAYDIENANHRKYPTSVWDKQMSEGSSLQKRISARLALGELEHPESGNTHLARISHLLERVWEETIPEKNDFGVPPGRYVLGEYLILDTPNGQILQELHAVGVPVGVSSRGRGDLAKDEAGVDVVQDNYECETWDCVYSPSVDWAYTKPIKESDEPADSFNEMEALAAKAEALDGSDLLSLVEVGSRTAQLIERAVKDKNAVPQPLVERLKEARKRIVGLWQEKRQRAVKGRTKLESPRTKARMNVAEAKSRTAQMLAEMAKRMVAAEARQAPAKALTEEVAAGKAPQARPPAATKAESREARLESNLQMTDAMAEKLLGIARQEKKGRLRAEALHRATRKMALALRERGLRMSRQLALLEAGRKKPETNEAAKGDGSPPARPRPRLSEATGAAGIKDPSESKTAQPVAPAQTLISGLAARGM